MALVVQKYGGSSLGDSACIKNVATRIKSAFEAGDKILVVVSAMYGVTNNLLKKGKNFADFPNLRELDALLCTGELESAALLSIALNSIGVQAVSKNALQLGIFTNSDFGDARILAISAENIADLLEKSVVIVPGFQGIDENLNFTTLGRGGSDLTALAIAKRINADRCEIFSDVDGVHVCDPKIVPNSRFIDEISHDNLLRLSLLDNKVMYDRSVAFALQNKIKFSIASSFKCDCKHTNVVAETSCAERQITGITYRKHLVLLKIQSLSDVFKKILKIFNERNIGLNFVKNSKISENSYLIEVAIDGSEWKICESFICECLGDDVSLDIVQNLSRIDIVGCDLQKFRSLDAIFDVVESEKIERSEYGKFGYSFLLQTENFDEILMNLSEICEI